MRVVEQDQIPIGPPTLTKNQKKKLKKREREMKKKQAAAQTGDESEPMSSLSQLVEQVISFKKEMLEVIDGLQSEHELEVLKTALIKMKTSTAQAFARKLADDLARDSR